MSLLHHDLGQQRQIEIVEVALRDVALIRLVNNANCLHYRRGKRHQFDGGPTKKSSPLLKPSVEKVLAVIRGNPGREFQDEWLICFDIIRSGLLGVGFRLAIKSSSSSRVTFPIGTVLSALLLASAAGANAI
jgi:hypothetical protein